MKTNVILVLVALLCSGGCGGPHAQSISGIVTLDGTPVDLATVTFVPEETTTRGGVGRTDAEGKFTVSTDGAESLENGDYRIILMKPQLGKPGEPPPPPGSSALPAIYQNPETTPLKISLPLTDKLILELKSGN